MESNHDKEKHPCPCCGDRTLNDRRRFEICTVCFWQDDGQDDIDADIVYGGPNGSLSLTTARKNYQALRGYIHEISLRENHQLLE
jgi:Cysteine-rich CPCC